jgi:short-subunit dehydrogenase
LLRADLSVDADVAALEKRLADERSPVTVLINNAGFGINKSFTVSDRRAERDLVDVMVKAPMLLMHSALPRMIKADYGIVINVSSVAGWIAAGTYSAAKSYLTVLSESLHAELHGTNVKVSALCPGFTRTEFHERGRMRMQGLPGFMWLDVDHVVRTAWRRAQAGKLLAVPGWQYKLLSAVARLAPRVLVRRAGINVRRRQRPGHR